MRPTDEEITKAVGQHGSAAQAARALGFPERSFRRWYKKLKFITPEQGDKCRDFGINPDHLRGGWIKDKGASYRFAIPEQEQDRDDVVQAIKDALADIKPSKATPAPKGTQSSLCTYYPLVDVHLGMLSWGEETGEDYDSNIARDRVNAAMLDLVSSAPNSKRGVVLNIGDFTHANDATNKTASGHVLDVDSRMYKTIFAATELAATCIEAAKEKHETVLYRGLRGNHDRDAHIGVTCGLANRYANDPRVDILADPNDFFAEQWGRNMVFSHHGDKAKPERLVMFAADEYAKVWGSTKYRFCWTGHIHHRSAKDMGGMLFESFRTLAPRDAYAQSHGYSSRQSMVAITLDKEHGERVRNQVNY